MTKLRVSCYFYIRSFNKNAELAVLKRIVIHLKHPFCACYPLNLEQGIYEEKEQNYYGIYLRRKTCGAKLDIPSSQFVVRVQFDAVYPKNTSRKQNDVVFG